MLLHTFTAVSCPMRQHCCAAGQSAAPLLLLRELVAFLTLIEAAERLEGGCYSCLCLSRYHCIQAAESFFSPPLRLVPTMCTKGHVESLLFFGGGGLSCGSRDWITLCSFQALEEINWTGIWYPISAGGIWLSGLISTIVHVHKDKWRISACHVL